MSASYSASSLPKTFKRKVYLDLDSPNQNLRKKMESLDVMSPQVSPSVRMIMHKYSLSMKESLDFPKTVSGMGEHNKNFKNDLEDPRLFRSTKSYNIVLDRKTQKHIIDMETINLGKLLRQGRINSLKCPLRVFHDQYLRMHQALTLSDRHQLDLNFQQSERELNEKEKGFESKTNMFYNLGEYFHGINKLWEKGFPLKEVDDMVTPLEKDWISDFLTISGNLFSALIRYNNGLISEALENSYKSIVIVIEKLFKQEKLKWDKIVDSYVKELKSEKENLKNKVSELENLLTEISLKYDREISDLKYQDKLNQESLEFYRKELDEKQNTIEELLNPMIKDVSLLKLSTSVKSLNAVIKGIEKQSEERSRLYKSSFLDVVNYSAYKSKIQNKKNSINEEICSKYGFNKSCESSWELISPLISHPFVFFIDPRLKKNELPFKEVPEQDIVNYLESCIDDYDVEEHSCNNAAQFLVERILERTDNIFKVSFLITKISDLVSIKAKTGDQFYSFFSKLFGFEKTSLMGSDSVRLLSNLRRALKSQLNVESTYGNLQNLDMDIKTIIYCLEELRPSAAVSLEIEENQLPQQNQLKLINLFLEQRVIATCLSNQANPAALDTYPGTETLSKILSKFGKNTVNSSLFDVYEAEFEKLDIFSLGTVGLRQFKQTLEDNFNINPETEEALIQECIWNFGDWVDSIQEWVYYPAFLTKILTRSLQDELIRMKSDVNFVMVNAIDGLILYDKKTREFLAKHVDGLNNEKKIVSYSEFRRYLLQLPIALRSSTMPQLLFLLSLEQNKIQDLKEICLTQKLLSKKDNEQQNTIVGMEQFYSKELFSQNFQKYSRILGDASSYFYFPASSDKNRKIIPVSKQSVKSKKSIIKKQTVSGGKQNSKKIMKLGSMAISAFSPGGSVEENKVEWEKDQSEVIENRESSKSVYFGADRKTLYSSKNNKSSVKKSNFIPENTD